MLNSLFNKAALAMYGQNPNTQKEHWNKTIKSAKIQGQIIDLAYALEGEDEIVFLN